MMTVPQLCNELHLQVSAFDSDAKAYLHWLHQLGQSGFSPDTLAMRRLAADRDTLRLIADLMESMRQDLIGDVLLVNVDNKTDVKQIYP